MLPPILFFAFANDAGNYLPALSREQKNLRQLFRPKQMEGQLQLVVETDVTLEDVFRCFTDYPNRIALFHFAGHAGSQVLQMVEADGSPRRVNGVGIAGLFKREQALKVVFLNGCATRGQVNFFLESGVPAVIATSSAVSDWMAVDFSEQFYHALAREMPLGTAFETASHFIQAKYTSAPAVHFSRGLLSDQEPDILPWGVYTREKQAAILDWYLPRGSTSEVWLPTKTYRKREVEVNDILIEETCFAIAEIIPSLDDLLREEFIDISKIKREIIDCFPTPIGEQVRKLFIRSENKDFPHAMQDFTFQRLKQLVHTFQTTTQFLGFTLLSQLWDIKHHNPGMDVEQEYMVDLHSFFTLQPDTTSSFDYYQLTRSLSQLFLQKGITPFIDELSHFVEVEREAEFSEAVTFFQKMAIALRDEHEQPAGDVRTLCQEAESHLGKFLKRVVYLVKYKLATIKYIELVKNRHETPRYIHNHILLNNAFTVAGTGSSVVPKNFQNFTDSRCVLFLKTKGDQVLDYLNLSPFLIDENALNGEFNPKLYFYLCRKEQGYLYQFLNNANEPPIVVDKDRYPTVKSQLDRFKAQLLGVAYFPNSSEKAAEGLASRLRKRAT